MAERLVQRIAREAEATELLFIAQMEKHIFSEEEDADLIPPFLPVAFLRFAHDLRNMVKDSVTSLALLKTEKKVSTLYVILRYNESMYILMSRHSAR